MAFLYNSDRGTNTAKQRTFIVTKPIVIRNAGLVDCVPVYVAVGTCISCANDILWAPLSICGTPVTVCPDNTELILALPGTYCLGDPNADGLMLPGDVNVVYDVIEDKINPAMLHLARDSACTGGRPCAELDHGPQTSW